MKRFFLTYLLCTPLWASSPVLQLADHIRTTLTSTHYTHTIKVDAHRGIYDVDCSAFASYVLSFAAPEAYAELRSTTAPKRPLAKDFVARFEKSSTDWTRIVDVTHLVRGDLVAWLIPPSSESKDTGHVMIVAGPVTMNPSRPDEYLVPVIDSAISGHGKADPRRKAGPNGVGQGNIGLIVDYYRRPIAFRWSGGESTETKYTKIRLARPRD